MVGEELDVARLDTIPIRSLACGITCAKTDNLRSYELFGFSILNSKLPPLHYNPGEQAV